MPLPTPTFVAGIIFLLYVLSFVLFAFIRVVTGVSIQRLGFSGLRRIAFTPTDGIHVKIRGLGLTLHRPTFAQPTWLSVVVTELTVTADLKELRNKPRKKSGWTNWGNGSTDRTRSGKSTPELSGDEDVFEDASDEYNQRSRTWERLTQAKERIKRLHRSIKWIRLVDLVATSSTLIIAEVGSVHIGGLSMAVDTRRKTVDRSRLFNHHKASANKEQRPAEWLCTIRSVLFTPEGKESTEVLDHCTLNVHGMLYRELDGLRDASIALKLGRLSIPYDDVKICLHRAQRSLATRSRTSASLSQSGISLGAQSGAREENIVRTVSDSREFASSILRGIHEFQFAVSFFGLTKQIHTGHDSGSPVFLNMSMKEVGMDLLRLDPRSPAHLMYFSPNDIAHQALLAAISISVGVDDGHDHPERLLYIPMATMTLNTTLPSKTIQFSKEKNSIERNTNILFANLVITSPSLDLDPKHLPLILAMFRNYESKRKPRKVRNQKRHLVRRLLPKASIKISVHEPVVRVTLPPTEPIKKGTEEFDLLISASSSFSLDVESSHAADGDLHYALVSTFRMNSQQLYYQTASGEKYNLLLADHLELKLHLTASPDVSVIVNGLAQSFSVYLVRPEISEGLRQIVVQLQKDVRRRRGMPKSQGTSFLRSLPSWLAHVQLQGSDVNIEVAGVDPDVSKHARGVALHLESWTAEYRQNKGDEHEPRVPRRRAPSRTINRDEYLLRPTTPSSPNSPRKQLVDATDGRRLALHWKGFEGFVLEAADQWESDPFLSLPRMEVAFTTSTDKQGPVFHIHSFCQSLFLHYSLYRHFAIGIATMVLKRSFNPSSKAVNEPISPRTSRHLGVPLDSDDIDSATGGKLEIVTVDVKAHFMQIKADMPAEPPLMLHVYGLEAGRHRWTSPFLRSRLIRMYAGNPHVGQVWSRLVSVKSLRMDYRQSKRRYGNTITEDKSFDIVSDAIRLAVPHQLVMHKVFDNVANVVKTVKQLHHRFKTGTNEYVLDKDPEGPRHVPKISFRSRAVLFEIEDGSFEWKLGVIYRHGLMEQKQRLAREHAFDIKVKKLHEEDDRSRHRTRSAHAHRGRSKSRKNKDVKFRSKSETGSDRGSPHQHRSDHPLRYDKDGRTGLSGSSRTSVEEARDRLNRLNAQTWKKRIDHAMAYQNHSMNDIRSLFWGLDDIADEVDHKETILAIPQRPALMMLVISDLDIILDKPSFPISEYPKFLHRMGKGMPYDMQYSLLIPMHVQVNMGEAKIQLRDYPLPLIHVPAIQSNQPTRHPSLSMKTDFVIAEEYRNAESSRVSRVVIIPTEKTATGDSTGGLAVDVRRTIAPVKTYSDMTIDIDSAYPTRITWGTSYQPAIQDMMQVIESFTKPAVDPSERVGFWDKIRLTFHSRFNVSWKGDGDVHLILKGSRDPYMVTGHGAGFIMCWQNDVHLSIAQDEDPRNFMVVNSGSYILAIPDLGHYARHEAEVEQVGHGENASSITNYKQLAIFKKTVMKLNGNVRWVAGLVFERNLEQGKRSFDFIPHYEVVLKNPKYVKPGNGRGYDAFKGFRSHHIHMSLAIAAPYDREWSVANLEPSKTYNSVHLTPRFFTHFFNWWSMFSGAMSLPIRQGKIWPGIEKSSKKFGRHLATIKYNLLLSPLYMSHVYKHKDAEDYGQGIVSATGLKARVDSFMLDLHMRREEFRTVVEAPKNQQDSKQNQTTGMRINQVLLDLIKTDVRAVSARIGGTDSDDVETMSPEVLASCEQEHVTADLSSFTIPDNDWGWVDMDDFVELGWILPSDRNPDTHILPLAFAPRFTYFRQTDHGDNISGDAHRTSPFGNEPTHHCVMSARNDPRRVQCYLIEQRLERVKEQLSQNQRAIGEQELHIVRKIEDHGVHQKRLESLRNHSAFLQRKQEFLLSMHQSLLERLETNDGNAVPDVEKDEDDEYFEAQEEYSSTNSNTKGGDPSPAADYISDFNNRFIIHNVHLKWSNSLRNIILRYIHQVSQRRGFVYYMSRRAVKFILDIVEEQKKSRQPPASGADQFPTSPMSPEQDDELSIHDRVQQLLNDGKRFVNANDPDNAEGTKSAHDHPGDDIAVDFLAQNAYIVRVIAPQIQLQSEKDTKAAVLVTAKGMQLKIIQIMDKDRVMDEVSGLVQRRFTAAMDSLQIFVTNSKGFTPEDIHMYSGSTYGTPTGSAWPPWVPFEVMFEFNTNPYGFQRVVQRTSASLRYDKYNTLRLKYNDDVSGGDPGTAGAPPNTENRIDHVWVDFPHVRALCNSRQYYAMYVIVLDLLLYSEPLEKTRNERLEKIMLASDFSDLTGAPGLVIGLQERIRQLEEIKMAFQIHEKSLDKQGWNDRVEVEKDLTIFEDELFFVMKAITTSQRKSDDRAQTKQSTGLLRYYISASDIVWHLLREGQESLAEFQLKNALYDRTDNNDGSNLNSMEIEQMTGLNLLPNALYPNMISPYMEDNRPLPENENSKMLRVHWVMLEAIAGIPVMDHFEVNLFPLKVQLEYDIGKKLFEYVFPGVKDNTPDSGGFSPFLVKHMLPAHEEEKEEEESASIASTSHSNVSVVLPETEGNIDAVKLRLVPTLRLPDPQTKLDRKSKSSPEKRPHIHNLRLFRDSQSRSGSEFRRTLHPSSALAPDNVKPMPRPGSLRSGSTSNTSVFSVDSDRTTKRFTLSRSTTSDKKSSANKNARSDDLTQMMTRASNYMTLAHVKIPSMVLCLSFKGKGQRNFEDVHDLVFRMPTLEYRNKTWSNLDLALQLKKDVIRALISHAGAIVGNKFSHHRPNKNTQTRLRQIANSSAMLNTSPNLSGTDSNSLRDQSPGGSDASGEIVSRRSFASGRGSMFSTVSEESSMRSGISGPSTTGNGVGSVMGGSWRDGGLGIGNTVEDGRAFAEELSRVDQTEPDHANMITSLSRHFTQVTPFGHKQRSGSVRDSAGVAGEDNDDTTRKKSRLLLGKKFLGRGT
ncbi:mitochondrial protein from FMP27-domain-containing protein [Massariosphaeria phaeospora]|uniref:Mitochondrial protein from FMP27-domain-containing protein n=1 Tax=Massariosphaeria phaeospora TaxID=100035 RepID=A0A7C8M1V7_9PLEO|nr:mitochondrial protein from FMP27-domain-containing protein [Massariosphaeria phaeospora]